MLPVHLACRNGASKGVVTTLLHAFPDSLHVQDRKGRTPLHFVEQSTSQNREAVLAGIKKFQQQQQLLMVGDETDLGGGGGGSNNNSVEHSAGGPSAASGGNGNGGNEVDYEHRTILFKLILKKDWNAVIQRAAVHPQEAATWIVTKGFNGNLRFLPLHKACVLSPPVGVIDALLEAYPEGARCTDQDRWCPLHCACFYGASEEVVRALLRSYEKGAQCLDDDGRIPLAYSCLKAADYAVVMALLCAFPKGAMVRDGENRLPLHQACSKGASEKVVAALLKVAPKAAQAKDNQGRLALHHATRKSASEGVVRTLLRVYPRAAQTPDDTQKLPIHYACQANGNGKPSVAVVEQLLAAYPESINIKNGFGFTPLAEAKAADASAKMGPIVEALEAFRKKQGRIRSRDGGGDEGSADMSTAEAAALQARVVALEDALRGIGLVAQELKSELGVKKSGGKKDAAVLGPVRKFANKLQRIVEDALPEEA